MEKSLILAAKRQYRDEDIKEMLFKISIQEQFNCLKNFKNEKSVIV